MAQGRVRVKVRTWDNSSSADDSCTIARNMDGSIASVQHSTAMPAPVARSTGGPGDCQCQVTIAVIVVVVMMPTSRQLVLQHSSSSTRQATRPPSRSGRQRRPYPRLGVRRRGDMIWRQTTKGDIQILRVGWLIPILYGESMPSDRSRSSSLGPKSVLRCPSRSSNRPGCWAFMSTSSTAILLAACLRLSLCGGASGTGE